MQEKSSEKVKSLNNNLILQTSDRDNINSIFTAISYVSNTYKYHHKWRLFHLGCIKLVFSVFNVFAPYKRISYSISIFRHNSLNLTAKIQNSGNCGKFFREFVDWCPFTHQYAVYSFKVLCDFFHIYADDNDSMTEWYFKNYRTIFIKIPIKSKIF